MTGNNPFKWRHFESKLSKGQIRQVDKGDIIAQNKFVAELFGIAA